MSEHPDIDMISFTGSTRAGIDVAKRAAPTVKRVSQELGGKSPNVILEGADLAKAGDRRRDAHVQQLRHSRATRRRG
jgi:aldehyde dehydrogenase (NAD+)